MGVPELRFDLPKKELKTFQGKTFQGKTFQGKTFQGKLSRENFPGENFPGKNIPGGKTFYFPGEKQGWNAPCFPRL